MSLDANYILSYYTNGYLSITPIEKDIEYLKNKYGGHFEYINKFTVYWEKPKYTLPDHELDNLLADQVLERKDCELWEIIK